MPCVSSGCHLVATRVTYRRKVSPHARENSVHHQLGDADLDLTVEKNQKETKRRKEETDLLLTDRRFCTSSFGFTEK